MSDERTVLRNTPWIGFLAMCLAMFMAILDIQVVASSLTRIGASLGAPPDRLSWVQNGYLTAEVVSIPLTGWLTRALSLRWTFAVATAAFTLASLGCALCTNIDALIAVRVVQGFFGGMLVPSVFTSVFTLVPEKQRVAATTIASLFAVLAPTIGPIVGGYLTQTLSWNWIFLINVAPGAAVSILVLVCLDKEARDLPLLMRVDFASVALASAFLASLEILMKEGPKHGWSGTLVQILTPACALTAALGVWRMFAARNPLVQLSRFRRVSFSVGCALSFTFGAGIFGSIYAVAVFLGLVRGYGPLAIGIVMLVSGAAQLATAPFAAVLETRVPTRILVAAGFGVFAIGLYANSFTTTHSGFSELFWPQILRGSAVMFCLLSATDIALDGWPQAEVAEASALFNLMRTLGGAIGIALIDTILQQQAHLHAAELVARLSAGDLDAARTVGLPLEQFRSHVGAVTAVERAFVAPLVERAALAQAFNDAWRATAALVAVSLALLPLVRRGAYQAIAS